MNSSTEIVTLVNVKSTNSAHEGQHNSTIIIIIVEAANWSLLYKQRKHEN